MFIVALQHFRLPADKQTAKELFCDTLLIAGFCCLLIATDMSSWEGWAKPLAVIQFQWCIFEPARAFLAFGNGLVLSTLVNKTTHRNATGGGLSFAIRLFLGSSMSAIYIQHAFPGTISSRTTMEAVVRRQRHTLPHKRHLERR